MIYLYHHGSLDWEGIETHLDQLRPIIIPEKASVADKVFEVVGIPACIFPVEDGWLEIVFVARHLCPYSLHHDILLLEVTMRERRGMASHRGRKMRSEPSYPGHMLVVVSTDLTELLNQTKAEFTLSCEGTIDLALRSRRPKEEVWERAVIDAAVK